MKAQRREIIAGRGFYYMPSAYVTIKVTVEGIYDHERMIQAVSYLEEAHPIINNVLCKSGDKMWFEDIGKHVPVRYYNDENIVKWEDALLQITTEPINLLENPGVMIGVVERTDRFYLLMVCHHMYGDGLSVKYLMDDLLYIYCTGNKLRTREAMTELGEADLTLDYQIPGELRENYVSFAETCKMKNVEFSWEAYKQMIDTHNEMIGTGLTCRNIKGTVYRSLKGKCKEMGVTVNSALTTAMVAALQQAENVDVIISVDTRTVFGHEEKKGIGNYASCIQPTLQYDNTIGFWENVVIVDEKIKAERLNKTKMMNTLYTFMLWGADVFGVGYYARYGLFRDMEVLMQLRKTLGLNSDAETFDISNIGLVEYAAASEDFVVRDCYFIPNLMPATACTFGVATLDNVITISLEHKKKLVPDEQARAILHDVVSYLVRNM